MGIAIAIAVSVPAYLAGFTALFMGMGWLASLAVLWVTGFCVALVLFGYVLVRQKVLLAQAPGLQLSTR